VAIRPPLVAVAEALNPLTFRELLAIAGTSDLGSFVTKTAPQVPP